MKITIIGAGISGLALYLFLRKEGLFEDNEVLIYESREAPKATEDWNAGIGSYEGSFIGGSLGLGRNGLSVLRRLDAELYEELRRAGNPVDEWRMSSARGWTLAFAGKTDRPGANGVIIWREQLWRVLRKRVPDDVVLGGKKVVRVERDGEAGVSRLHFSDGNLVEADLVVGADGIWSAVRKAMLCKEGADAKYELEPHYEGLIGVGGMAPTGALEGVPRGQMKYVANPKQDLTDQLHSN
jgi:2-polyprenyl-6-methoxyphenol hydroxylase-like FAD-dependent oxidoreductase